MEVQKYRGGRKSKFKVEYVEIAYNLAKEGMSRTEVAEKLGAKRHIFNSHKAKRTEWFSIQEAYDKGAEEFKISNYKFDKLCKKCGGTKRNIDFSKSKHTKDGCGSYCIQCNTEIVKNQKKTKKGLVFNIYSTQKSHSKKRGHNHPLYTKEELLSWCLLQKQFDCLYNNWVNSNYETKSRPSVDRINDNIGYTIENIQLMTWNQNKIKGRESAVNRGKEKKSYNKRVIQSDKDGAFINIFNSLTEAEKETGIKKDAILRSVNKRQKFSGGFIWKRVD